MFGLCLDLFEMEFSSWTVLRSFLSYIIHMVFIPRQMQTIVGAIDRRSSSSRTFWQINAIFQHF